MEETSVSRTSFNLRSANFSVVIKYKGIIVSLFIIILSHILEMMSLSHSVNKIKILNYKQTAGTDWYWIDLKNS